jgi:LysR family transcriptional regulator, nitrogen assimilation regulatory protein
MDVRQLRYFIAIAEEGSLSAAALRIGVAQPSLSQHVANLEEAIGVQLLSRTSRGVTLTEPGNLLLAHARQITAAVDRAKEEVRQSGSEPRGSVVFGLPSSISMVLSVPLAETVRHELPNVRLRAIEAMSGFIQTWLEDRTVDPAILYDVSMVRHMQLTQLASEDLFFFSAPDNWPLDVPPGTPISLQSLSVLDLILPSPSHGLRVMIDRYARNCGVDLNIALEMDALMQIKALVARGSGYTILAPAAAQDDVDRGDLVRSPIVEPVMRRPVYLVRNPAKPVTHASNEVERITRSVMRELVARNIWQVSQESPAEPVAARSPA